MCVAEFKDIVCECKSAVCACTGVITVALVKFCNPQPSSLFHTTLKVDFPKVGEVFKKSGKGRKARSKKRKIGVKKKKKCENCSLKSVIE